ncbi:hypothetical protein EDB89DRAFT_1905611 [Lactarius sanguifluus]|nr:hypothetical protein EDB89DRAFT_1905611 [Lactarius sanguifluus]
MSPLLSIASLSSVELVNALPLWLNYGRHITAVAAAAHCVVAIVGRAAIMFGTGCGLAGVCHGTDPSHAFPLASMTNYDDFTDSASSCTSSPCQRSYDHNASNSNEATTTTKRRRNHDGKCPSTRTMTMGQCPSIPTMRQYPSTCEGGVTRMATSTAVETSYMYNTSTRMPKMLASLTELEEGLAVPDKLAVSGELPVVPEVFSASDEPPAAEELTASDELLVASDELPVAPEELPALDTSAAPPEELTMPEVPEGQITWKIKFLPLKDQPSQLAEDNDVEMKEVDEPVKQKAKSVLPQIKFECDRCASKGVVCKTWPTRPCDQCQADKAKCSLVPHDKETGKPIRGKLLEDEVLLFRLEEYKKKLEKAVTGRAAEEPAASGSRLSPSSTLEWPLHGMTLESSGSSHADSPTTEPASVPSPSAKIFCVKVPAPKFWQGQCHSPAAASQSSDGGRNHKARLAVLEAKMNVFKEWKKEVDRWLKEGGL